MNHHHHHHQGGQGQAQASNAISYGSYESLATIQLSSDDDHPIIISCCCRPKWYGRYLVAIYEEDLLPSNNNNNNNDNNDNDGGASVCIFDVHSLIESKYRRRRRSQSSATTNTIMTDYDLPLLPLQDKPLASYRLSDRLCPIEFEIVGVLLPGVEEVEGDEESSLSLSSSRGYSSFIIVTLNLIGRVHILKFSENDAVCSSYNNNQHMNKLETVCSFSTAPSARCLSARYDVVVGASKSYTTNDDDDTTTVVVGIIHIVTGHDTGNIFYNTVSIRANSKKVIQRKVIQSSCDGKVGHLQWFGELLAFSVHGSLLLVVDIIQLAASSAATGGDDASSDEKEASSSSEYRKIIEGLEAYCNPTKPGLELLLYMKQETKELQSISSSSSCPAQEKGPSVITILRKDGSLTMLQSYRDSSESSSGLIDKLNQIKLPLKAFGVDSFTDNKFHRTICCLDDGTIYYMKSQHENKEHSLLQVLYPLDKNKHDELEYRGLVYVSSGFMFEKDVGSVCVFAFVETNGTIHVSTRKIDDEEGEDFVSYCIYNNALVNVLDSLVRRDSSVNVATTLNAAKIPSGLIAEVKQECNGQSNETIKTGLLQENSKTMYPKLRHLLAALSDNPS